jgi:hypothetical protein
VNRGGGGDSSSFGNMDLDNFGDGNMDFGSYLNGNDGDLDDATKKGYEEENSKRVEQFRKMMETMQTLKDGHENFKKFS